MSGPDGAGAGAAAAGPPPNWREGRQRYMVGFLQAALVVVVGLAALALLLPDDAGTAAAVAMIALLVAVPVVRITWLLVRWLRLGDRRFAATAAGMLGVLALGAAVAFL